MNATSEKKPKRFPLGISFNSYDFNLSSNNDSFLYGFPFSSILNSSVYMQQYFSFDIDGRKFERETHERHKTCLPALQKRYADLSSESKAALKDVLEESACLNYLAAGN